MLYRGGRVGRLANDTWHDPVRRSARRCPSEMQNPDRPSGHRREGPELFLLFGPEAITGSLDLAEEPVREVRRIHQEIGRLCPTVFQSVAKSSANRGR